MKKTFLLVSLLSLSFSFGIGAFAQETELPDAGLTPDSLFYVLEWISEGIGTFFTFGDIKKAERYAALAAERLAEVQVMVEKGKHKFVEKTLQRYENQLNNSIARAKKAQTKGKNTEKVMEVVVRVGQATSKHLEVLAQVYEKVPEQAKPAIENAIKASVKGHEKAVEVLKEKNALGEIPEEVTLPEEVPQEVRERIQERAQQELQVEEFLEEPAESFESVRNRCIEEGGPREMCEKIPLKGFKSFKELKDFCLGVGSPSEFCAVLEEQCKEVGATTANECFRLLTATATTAYEAATPTSTYAPPLSEEEMEERRRIEEESRIQGEVEEAPWKDDDDGDSSSGIGAEIGIRNNQLTIVALQENSPAEKAGLQIGDNIKTIDGESTVGVSIVDAVGKISGGTRTKVVLTILRNDEEGNSTVSNISVTRAYIDVPTSSSSETQCEFNEMIFYYREGCGWCQKVKDDGTIDKLEEFGVKVTQINTQVGPVDHQFQGVPTFVVNKNIYSGYRTLEDLKELLHCQ